MWSICRLKGKLPSGNDFKFEHPRRRRRAKFLAHNPPPGKETRLGQSEISNAWSEVRCWNPLESKDIKFWIFDILREVRVEGNSISSGNDSTSSYMLIPNWKRKGSFCISQCMQLVMSLSQLRILIDPMLGGNSSYWKDSALDNCLFPIPQGKGAVRAYVQVGISNSSNLLNEGVSKLVQVILL